MRHWLLLIGLFLMTNLTAGETESDSSTQVVDETKAAATPVVVQPKTEPKINTALVLGMNVRGNKESPLSLTIVPWRSADHNTSDPQIMASWRPELGLLEPAAYRRNINAFLKSRVSSQTARTLGTKNENQ